MKEHKSKVRQIGRMEVDWHEIMDYLDEIGGEEWLNRIQLLRDGGLITDDAILAEFAGRLCYKSFVENLNPNVTRVRKDTEKYFENILKVAHGSVLEHNAQVFLFSNVSRVFTHELVRHRIGSFSQESMRFVRPDTNAGLGIVKTGLATDKQEVWEKMTIAFEHIEEVYSMIENEIGFDEIPFSEKKIITSFMRRILPLGVATNIIWTANHRTIRWVLEMRTEPFAEEEIHGVFMRLGEIVKQNSPLFYLDFEKQVRYPDKFPEVLSWVPKYKKV